jgi:uncharacterized protein (DUF1697 family)
MRESRSMNRDSAGQAFVGLLRGVNVGGRHKIRMAELRSICAGIGWEHVQTYIQSGNAVFAATGSATTLESQLERAIERQLGFSVPAVVRSRDSWRRYVETNPFPGASQHTPNFVALALSKGPVSRGAVAELRRRAADGEEVVKAGDALWIHYRSGMGRSKLSPSVLDRSVGSPVTVRNWRTVLELSKMVDGSEA